MWHKGCRPILVAVGRIYILNKETTPDYHEKHPESLVAQGQGVICLNSDGEGANGKGTGDD